MMEDAIDYNPLRNVVGHTGFITKEGQKKLSTVYDNIKGRIINLLS